MNNGETERIPDHWYEKTATRFVCLRCKKTFSRRYKSRRLRSKRDARGSNMYSLWAWHNFRRHLLKCWGWHVGPAEEALNG